MLSKKQSLKKMGILALTMGMALSVVAGCGDGKDKGAKGTTADPGKDLGTINESVTLIFRSNFTGDTQEIFNTYYGDRIKKKFPNVTINFIPYGPGQTLTDLLTAGIYPDLIYGKYNDMDGYLLSNKLEYDMDEMVKKYNYNVDRFEPALIKTIRNTNPDGKLYGLPMPDFDPQVTFYNKDLFDKFGVAYPKDGMTWDDTYELAKKLTRIDGNQTIRGFSTGYGGIMRDNQLSVPYLDPKGDKLADQEKWKKIFENLSRFFLIPNNGRDVKDRNSQNAETAVFVKGNSAMQVNQLSQFRNFPADMNWDMATLPVFKEAPDTMNQASPAYWYITNTCQNKDAAFKVLTYLLSDEVQADYAANLAGRPSYKAPESVMKTIGQNVPALKGKHIEAIYKYKLAAPSNARDKGLTFVDGRKPIDNAFNKVIFDGTDINTALRGADEDIQKLIQTKKQAQ